MANRQSSNLLITGATGNIGSLLSEQLVSRGVSFKAMVRSEKDVAALGGLAGVTPVIGDFNQPAELAGILAGIDKLFLLTNSSEQAEQQQLDFVAAAVAAGVQHIVKLSQWEATAFSPVRFLRYHAAVEEAIVRSGVAYTFLRPNLFMQGLLGFRELIIHQHQFFASLGAAPVSLIDTRDIAEVAAIALTEEGHAGKTYSLTGPAAITHQEVAEILSEVTGRSIQFHNVPSAVMQEALLSAGFPRWQAEGLIEDYDHYARGEAAEVTSDVEAVTGHAPGSFRQFASDYARMFS